MSYEIHQIECVLLGREKSREFDEIISVCSRDLGIISIICYGLLRPLSKMRYHIDKGYILNLELVKGREFYILVGAKKGESILKPQHLLVWQSCVKVLTQFSGEHDDNSVVIYDMWISVFLFLKSHNDMKDLNIISILYLTVNMLFYAGLWPHSQFSSIYDSGIETAYIIISNHKKEIEEIVRRVINTIT